MTPKQAIAFVKANGVVLESATGSVPSLAEAIVGEPVRGRWWSHPRASEILAATRAVRGFADVLVCRIVDGKVTYLHRRLWPALVRLAKRFPADRLAALREVHTPKGRHEVQATPFPDWVREDVQRTAAALSEAEALSLLAGVLPDSSSTAKRARRAPRPPLTGSGRVAAAAPTVNDHFNNKGAGLRRVYDRLVAAVRKIGPVRESPKKTSIHLDRVTALAGVQVRKECLILTIKSDQPIDSPRVFKSEHNSANRYHHEVKLTAPTDVDAELRGWLKSAYDLSG